MQSHAVSGYPATAPSPSGGDWNPPPEAPLRPGPEDLATVQRVVRRWQAEHAGAPPRTLILGTTPELHALDWHVTPILLPQAEWADMRLAAASFDIVVCDGGLQLLPYPDGQRTLIEQLHRILAPDGQAVFRLFAPSPAAESPQDVVNAWRSGRIPNAACLRLRLWSALQADPQQGVTPAEAWQTLQQLAYGFPALTGLIDADREVDTRLHLVTPGEAVQLFSSAGFRRQSTIVPTYPLGRQCPTMVFTRT